MPKKNVWVLKMRNRKGADLFYKHGNFKGGQINTTSDISEAYLFQGKPDQINPDIAKYWEQVKVMLEW